MEKLDPCVFDWSTWRAGTLLDLGCYTRSQSIEENHNRLKTHAVGYCKGDSLPCRPKPGTYAVMFENKDIRFWTHLTKHEFERIS